MISRRAIYGAMAFLLMAMVAVGVLSSRARGASALIERLNAGLHQTVVVYGTSVTAGGAWVSQLSTSLNARYPGKITWVNAGLSGKASKSGSAQLSTLVLSQHPDAVFIEFGMNDAFTAYPVNDPDYGITLAQSQTNLNGMIDGVLSQNPAAVVVLQTMNGSWDAPNGNQSGTKRPQLAAYYQGYRDVAAARSLSLVDNFSVWEKVRTNSPAAFQSYVSDGTHPNATGYSRLVTPAIQWTLGADMGLVLAINPATGRGVLDNTSATGTGIIAYTISSASGSLRTSWDSLSGRGNANWAVANPTDQNLSELNAVNVQLIPAGAAVNLGGVWDVTKSLDVDFSYMTADGVNHAASVVYAADLALPGDFDGDGEATGNDFLCWQRSLGGSVPPFSGTDTNGNGVIDRQDLDAWLSAFGSSEAMRDVSSAVPEASTGTLSALATMAVLLRRVVWCGATVGAR